MKKGATGVRTDERLHKQERIFRAFDRGDTIEQVAERMGISKSTTRHHHRRWAKQKAEAKA